MPFGNLYSELFSDLENSIFFKKSQKYLEDLKFCMNELFNNVFKVFSFLKFREVHFGYF
jgi:hypothetical protein